MLCPNPKCQEELSETVRFCGLCGAQIRRQRSHNVAAAVGRGLVPGEIFKFRYRIEGFLGFGGATVVYAARDQEFDDLPVALKILPAEVVMDEQFRGALARDARAGLTLVHENIARLYYFMGKAQLAYVVSELVPGPSLDLQRIQEGREEGHERWALGRAIDLLLPIAEALDYAHEKGMLHRELKPSNIILATRSGKVVPKITDFGVSAVIRDAIDEQDGQLPVESRFYLAPERLRKETVSRATDVYSLGLILYQLLAGRLPFKLADWEKKITGEESPAPIEDLSQVISDAVLRALLPEPERRYGSATQFLAAVRGVAGLGPPAEIRVVSPEPPAPKVDAEPGPTPREAEQELPFFLWVIGACLIVGILGSILFSRLSPSDPGPDPSPSPGDSVVESLRPVRPPSPPPGSPPASPSPGGETVEPSIPPFELAGPITFETDPPGASVFIDGRSTGVTTPCTLTGITSGRVEFTFQHPECETLVREETLEPSRPVLFQVALARHEVAPMEPNPQGMQRFRNTRDGAIMVRLPGTDLLIDEIEVTNAMYRKFVVDTGYRKPTQWGKQLYGDPEQPVVGVSWRDAVAYCEWAGKELPREAVWEQAVRGGLTGKKYPWGDDDPDGKAEYGKDYETGKARRVRSFPPNAWGLYEASGNVWEWCDDGAEDKPGFRIIRGGSFLQPAESITLDARNALKENFDQSTAVGFRCIRRIPESVAR